MQITVKKKKLHGLRSLWLQNRTHASRSSDFVITRTPLGPLTITYRGKENKENFLKVSAVKQWWIEEEA